MTEQPDAPSPYRPVALPTFPDDGILDASMEEVIGLALSGNHIYTRSPPRVIYCWEKPEPFGTFGEQLESGHGSDLVAIAGSMQQVTKMRAVVSMSQELRDDWVTISLAPPTAEQRVEAEARQAAWQTDRDRRHAEAVAEWERVRARYADSPAVTAVLDLHEPTDRLECTHEVFGYEADAEDWPCSTYLAIRDAPQ